MRPSSILLAAVVLAWSGPTEAQFFTPLPAPADRQIVEIEDYANAMFGSLTGRRALAEQALGGSMGRFMAVAEAYPELKADATMQSLGEELTSTENRIGFARQAYNDEVLDYNDATSRFPALVAARLFGFAPAAMLQATQNAQERDAPRVAF